MPGRFHVISEQIVDPVSRGYSQAEWTALQPANSPAWWHGASAEEVIRFDLSPLYPGVNGSAIALLSDEDLELHLAEVEVRLEHQPTATAWLKRYARWLAREQRQRG